MEPMESWAYKSRLNAATARDQAIRSRVLYDKAEFGLDRGQAQSNFDRDWQQRGERLGGQYARGGVWNSGIRQRGYQQYAQDRQLAQADLSRNFARQKSSFTQRLAEQGMNFASEKYDIEAEAQARRAQIATAIRSYQQ